MTDDDVRDEDVDTSTHHISGALGPVGDVGPLSRRERLRRARRKVSLAVRWRILETVRHILHLPDDWD